MKKIAALAALLALSAATAFAAPKYVVGIVQLVEHPSLDDARINMLEEMKEAGFGPDVVEIDYQNGQNSPSLISTICQKFISRGVDLIVPIATPAAQGAAALTESIPLVFAAVSDPVAAGLVRNREHPEGNVTGVCDEVQPDRILDLAEELTPGLKHYGIIYNTAEVNSVSTVRNTEAEMERRGITYREAVATTTAEAVAAINSLIGKVDAVYIPDDNTAAASMPLLAEAAKEHRLPVYVAADMMVHDGGLATCGISYKQLGRQTGRMVMRILSGASVSDTPVEVPAQLNVVINEETAQALGIDISKYAK